MTNIEDGQKTALSIIGPKLKSVEQDDGAPRLQPDMMEIGEFTAAAALACGSLDRDCIGLIVHQVIDLIPQFASDVRAVNGVLSILASIGPENEVEAMLAVQMVAVHFASTQATTRAMHPKTPPAIRNMELKHAGQLMRTYTQQMEALNRNRGKGQQKMTVEHVNVHEGGQAIVGNVEGPQRGRTQKLGEQPDGA